MSELLQHDDDAIDEEGPNDIDVSRMGPGGQTNIILRLGDPLNFNSKYETYSLSTTTFLVLMSRVKR
jgi:hypothetical protein